MSGTDLIAIERHRQITEEGYDADTGHAEELASAAVCYATEPGERRPQRGADWEGVPFLWPWAPKYWKPTPGDRIRELVKAGALIAAAIDSLQASDSPEKT